MRFNTLSIDTLAPQDLARLARLRYVTGDETGFGRLKNGSEFHYTTIRGTRLHDAGHLARIEQLAIPPAWRDVWICRFAKGHLQATGRDSRQRKQYVYHERWSEISNLVKFWRLDQFGRALPALRQKVASDLRGRSLTRSRVLAGCMAVLDATSIRVGNEEYVQQNNSFGLTTLRDRHVTVGARAIELRFVGKGGVRKEARIDDAAIVRLVKESRAVTGARLFQYHDDEGKNHAVTAADVNDYLREITGQPFTAKDFRTWKASALVTGKLFDERVVEKKSERRRVLKSAVDDAAELLNNTPTICRKYYIHPGLLAAYDDGSFADYFARFRGRSRQRFGRDEALLAHFLKAWEASSKSP